MRTLKLENGTKILIDNSPVEIGQLENRSEFLSGLMLLDMEISDSVTASDIIHFFYDAKDLIRGMMSEEYEAVRAMVTSAVLPRNYKAIRVYKSFRMEKDEVYDNDSFLYLIPEIELVPSEPGEDGLRNMGGLPVVIDENIKLFHENEDGSKVEINSKTKVTLLDLMTCIFDELPSIIKEGLVLSH
jgi:hypothetical protein